jgi:TonB family protein
MILVVSATCFGQQTAPANPAQPQSTAPVRDPNSTSADLAVPLCPAKFDDSLATDGIAAHFRDEGVTPPVVRHSVEAKFSDEARQQKRKGQELDFVVVMGLVVSNNGGPQNICIARSAGYGLDAKAAEAVQQYKFAPASKDGEPVAARLNIEVDFRLY